jgi:hypothetical protein
MRKLLFFVILLFGGAMTMASAQDMRTIFLNAPDKIFPLLTGNDRADLVDFIEADMKAKVSNRLDGVSELHELGRDYLMLATTASSTMQMKLLPVKDDTIICVVKTVKAEAADSRIRLYTKDWQPVDEVFFTPPSIADFFTPSDSVDELLDLADIYLVELKLSAEDNTLVAEYTVPQYMTKEDAERVLPFLRKRVYVWDGKKFQYNN